MGKLVVTTSEAPQPVGPYSQAIRCQGFVFCSGQVALDPESGELIEGSIADETARCLESLAEVLEAAGSDLLHVVKVTAYLIDMADFPEFNSAYEQFFAIEPPARVTIAVAGLPKGARVEIDCVAEG
jgi:2-iminobutanoate/2-iminopropanoate deaminase